MAHFLFRRSKIYYAEWVFDWISYLDRVIVITLYERIGFSLLVRILDEGKRKRTAECNCFRFVIDDKFFIHIFIYGTLAWSNHNCKNKFKIIKIFWSASKLNKIVLIKRKWSSDWEILARRRIMFKSVLKNIGRRRRIIDFSQIGKVVIRFIKTNPNNHFFWWDRDRNEVFLLNFWWFSLSLMKILDL